MCSSDRHISRTREIFNLAKKDFCISESKFIKPFEFLNKLKICVNGVIFSFMERTKSYHINMEQEHFLKCAILAK